MEDFLMPKYLYKYKSLSTDFTEIDFDKVTINDLPKLKYLSCTRVIEMIEDSKIYIPTRGQLNDPLEGANIPKMTFAVAGSWYYAAQHRVHGIVEEVLNSYRILSLSKEGKSPQMWAHYAGNYSGVCIRFSTEGVFGLADAVEYTSEKSNKIIDEPDNEDIHFWVKDSYYKKSDKWSYEGEYRILATEDQHFLHFDRSDIDSIIVGHNIKTEYRDRIVATANKYNIPVYSTWYSDSDYTIHIIKIEAIVNNVVGIGEDILNYAVELDF